MKYIRIQAVGALLCAMLALGFPESLHAHAILVQSSPKPDSTVKGPNLSVLLRFNVRVDGSRSRSTLVRTDGTTMPLAFDPQPKSNMLSGKATGLTAGKYKLQWQVLAADGHITRGEFTFYVE